MTYKYSKELYTKNSLLKAAYKFTDNAYIHLDVNESEYIVNIIPKKDTNIIDYDLEFCNQLLEERNREIVAQQTKNIREILFARAMASTVIYENESELDKSESIDDKSAMKDWFENE